MAPEGKAALASTHEDAGTHHVQVGIHIKLAARACDTAAVPAVLARSESSTASKRVSLSAAGKAASIKAGSEPAANPAAAPAAASASGSDSQQHAVHIRLSGLDGLQQEVPAGVATVPAGNGQSHELFTVALPDLQLAVTEQCVRSWAAAAAQLQVHVTVTSPAAADAASKKPGGPAGAAGAKAAAAAAGTGAPVATGTLLVNCAGLLVGDSKAAYRWARPVTAASSAAGASACADAASAVAGPGSFAGSSQQSLPASAAASSAGQQPRFKWNTQPPSGSLQAWLDSAEVELQVFKLPLALLEALQADSKAAAGKPQAASTATAAAAVKGAAKHGASGAARLSAADDAAAAEQATPPEPCSLLSPELASVLNPVVVCVRKAAALPASPASMQQLDTLCEGVKLRTVWGSAQVPSSQQPAASVSPWTVPSSSGYEGEALAVRSTTFAAPVIIFGCDIGQQHLMQLCRSAGLQLQVHDRTALPEPAPFTAARMQRQKELQQQQQQQRQAAPAKGSRSSTLKQGPGSRAGQGKAPAAAQQGAAAAATAATAAASTGSADAAAAASAATDTTAGPVVVSDDGEVFGCASVSLQDLAKGRTSCCFALPLRPVSTIRGGSLDWKGRPGRYLEANSSVTGWVRCAVPLHTMHASLSDAVAASAAATAATAAQQALAAAPPAAGGAAATATSTGPTEAAGAAVSSSGAGAKPGSKAAKGASAPQKEAGPGGKPAAARATRVSEDAGQQGLSACSTSGADAVRPSAQPQSSPAEQLPQPAAHVMLPSKARFPGHMTRAVFRMDYRDSDMLHVLEDAVRQHNAIVLGLAPPPPPTPQELAAAAAAKAAEEAAAAAAAAAAAEAAAAAAAAGAQRGRSGRPSSAGKAGPRVSSALAGKAAAAASGVKLDAASAAGAVVPAAAVQDPALASKAGARRQLAAAAAAAAAQAGTPRSILKQPQLAGAASGALAAEPSALTSGMASSRQHQQLRASFAGDLDRTAAADDDGGASGSESGEGSEEEELSEADQRLQAALQRYKHVELDQRLLQGLSTYQLSQEQEADAGLDVITGFHLVDGALRA